MKPAQPRYLLEFTVAPLVIPHVALRAETFAAVGAPEGPFIAMNPLMDSQVLLFRETFAAARERAAERLCPVVDMLVRLQADASLELLAAALKRTSEHLVIVSFCFLLVARARIGHPSIIAARMEALLRVLRRISVPCAGADHLTLFEAARVKI